MTSLLFLKLLAAAVSVALAAGLLARDHELMANRLIASFLLCNAYWATGEFYLFATDNEFYALQIFRWMTLGWLPMGLLCLHATLSLTSIPEHPVARWIPIFYVAVVLTVVGAVTTDWVIVDAIRRPLGTWRPVFGPGFSVAFLLMAAPLVTTLACWRGLLNRPDRDGENQLARILFFGLGISSISGSVTAVVLPLLGFDAIGITTSLVTGVGLGVAWTLQRYGHTLISPESLAREIFDTIDDGIVVVGRGGVVREANRAFGRMIRVDSSAAIGSEIQTWIPDFPSQPDTSGTSSSAVLTPRSGEILPIVISPPVELSSRPPSSRHIFLIRDLREVASLQRQLAVSGRLAAVGDLSKSIAESIHAPAAATQVHLEKLGSDWQAMSNWARSSGRLDQSAYAIAEGLEMIEECIDGVDRITSIVQEVGSFSAEFRRGGFTRHRLADIVESAVRIARAQAEPHIEIETHLDAEVEVHCHRSEIERVVTNIVVNAIHALDSVDREFVHIAVAIGSQADRALLHVEDDGCGIATSNLERVFDPFFTTKPVGRGTGLGLAISYHIVRKHGGRIRVSSIEGRGTSMTVELPKA